MTMNIVAICHEPFDNSSPQAIQIHRMLSFSRHSLTVFTSTPFSASSGQQGSHDLGPYKNNTSSTVYRVPNLLPPDSLLTRILVKVLGPLSQLPDKYIILWTIPLILYSLRYYTVYANTNAIVSFGSPMSCHVQGLLLSVLFRKPLFCHFSDPWSLNSYNNLSGLSRTINKYLERLILASANKIIFTSTFTLELYLGSFTNFPAQSSVVTHSASPRFFSSSIVPRNYPSGSTPVLRCIGNFYSGRTIYPFVRMLESFYNLSAQRHHMPNIEFYGHMSKAEIALLSSTDSSLKNCLHYCGVCSYDDSISLVGSSDGLIVIDAPYSVSPFFPSKLAEYFASLRPIFALTPLSSFTYKICSINPRCIASDIASNPLEVMYDFEKFLTLLYRHRGKSDDDSSDTPSPCSPLHYHPYRVASSFDDFLEL